MATRRRLAQTERTRSSIRTAHVIRRLQAFALGTPDPQTGRPVVMTAAQVQGALLLLRKVLPDLRAVELGGGCGPGSEVRCVVEVRGPMGTCGEVPNPYP